MRSRGHNQLQPAVLLVQYHAHTAINRSVYVRVVCSMVQYRLDIETSDAHLGRFHRLFLLHCLAHFDS